MASSSATTEQKKMLILKSSDGEEFELEESVAVQCGTIKNMVEEDFSHIPLPNVDAKTLSKIMEYMKKHAETDSNEEEIKDFDKKFVQGTFNDLYELVLAANYLHNSGLMDLLCQSIADRIKNKSVKAVREIFNVTNDFTPEEEAEVRKEHLWAHEEGQFDESLD
ncbi:SKP1-like protein 11 [Lycium ferocissimum]|uniref:SKP1-like protein 11 n=1 Tax=Lycium ferocissimum TaxID=112874 RepID=UPI0028156D62|nr:SKP1-like protein 11 [Lycium ferocissimum]